MYTHKFNPYDPTKNQCMLYTQFLANSFQATQTIKNYLSGARTFLKHNFIQSPFLNGTHITETLRGICRLSTHTPRQAPELSIPELKSVSTFILGLGHAYTGHHAALLISYAGFLRQSNALSCPMTPFHTILSSQLNYHNDILWITLLSSKTIIDSSQSTSLPIYPTHGRHCPVGAWFTHLAKVPRHPSSPAFLSDHGQPLKPTDLLTLLRLALSCNPSPISSTVTLHSLRRTAGRVAAKGGAPVEDVKLMGIWDSNAVYSYVPRRLFTRSAQIISQSLADKN